MGKVVVQRIEEKIQNFTNSKVTRTDSQKLGAFSLMLLHVEIAASFLPLFFEFVNLYKIFTCHSVLLDTQLLERTLL